jgi:hypothetical protein
MILDDGEGFAHSISTGRETFGMIRSKVWVSEPAMEDVVAGCATGLIIVSSDIQ